MPHDFKRQCHKIRRNGRRKNLRHWKILKINRLGVFETIHKF